MRSAVRNGDCVSRFESNRVADFIIEKKKKFDV